MSDLPVLQVVVGSTRPERSGRAIADWIIDRAEAHGSFDVVVTDLAEVDLPLFDEPRHPRLGEYEHDHTHRWADTVDRSDAFVFVVPEYNFSYNAATKNALDFLSREWAHKPAGFVSYGGVSAGTRAVVALAPVISALKMIPIPEAVHIPYAVRSIGEDGTFAPDDRLEWSADRMLDQVVLWEEVLRPLRTRTRIPS